MSLRSEKLRNYTKDSIQILLVKLLGIKKLEQRKLLDKDIITNSSHYLTLLKELKSSKIEPEAYLFLEQKLALFQLQKVNTKYKYSSWLNFVFGILMLGVFGYRFWKKRRLPQALLSKQEKTIKSLILIGRSNKEIAAELFISISTVKTHITNIYHKLRISNREELLLKNKK